MKELALVEQFFEEKEGFLRESIQEHIKSKFSAYVHSAEQVNNGACKFDMDTLIPIFHQQLKTFLSKGT